MNAESLDRLVAEAHAELARDERGPKLAQVLARYSVSCADWRTFALFDTHTYTRNLVHKDELFELIVLCWTAGQASPIHNHQGQRCWMAVLEGRIEETLYRMPRPGDRSLEAASRKVFERGSIAFITDDLGLHRIAPAGSGSAVSLHLYSKPIAECQVYDPGTCEVTLRTLAYHSVRGVRSPVPA